jgi:hypothetical protein
LWKVRRSTVCGTYGLNFKSWKLKLPQPLQFENPSHNVYFSQYQWVYVLQMVFYLV